MKSAIFILVLLIVISASGSALSDLAASMQPGEWAELQTNNIEVLEAVGASGIVFGYNEDLTWYPDSGRVFWVGGDHNDQPQFITYSEATNTWQRLTRPSWLGSGTMHGYDHQAIDVANGYFYHHPTCCSPRIQKYDIAQNKWLAPLPPLSYYSGFVGVEYFPELKGIVVVKPTVYFFADTATRWSGLATNLSMGGYHHFAEYNPVHKVMVFGGGNDPGARKIYKLDATGTVTPLKDAPVGLGIQQSIFTVDPVSGDYLIFTRGEKRFRVYDVTTDTWTLKSGTPPILNSPLYDDGVHGIQATPVSNYGVNLFVKAHSTGGYGNGTFRGWVYLYKHSEGTTINRTGPASAINHGNIHVSPNPFHIRTTVTLPFADTRTQISIYDLSGKLVKKIDALKGCHVTVDRGNLTNGIYLMRVRSNNNIFVKRLLIQK
jgi:hypothetical protein